MSTFGIDGLSSGLDSTGIINQLMQLERQPAVRMEQTMASNRTAVSALTAISGKLAAVDSAIRALTSPTTSFLPRKISSSGTHVTASVLPGAPLGTTTFSVEQLAATHRVVSASTVPTAATAVSAAGATITITGSGGPTDVAIAAGATLADVATAITASGAGVSAQVVDTGSGLKLQLAATAGGAGGVFTADLSALDGTAFAGGDTTTAVLVQGQDARVRVGTGPGAFDVTSSTGSFSTLLSGVTFTATAAKPGEQVTLAVEGDPEALTKNVKTFVDAVNAALEEMDRHTATGAGGGTRGVLAGDPTIRRLRDQVLTAVTFPVTETGLRSVGAAGVQSTREGRLTFDAAKLTAALQADPAAVERLFRHDDADAPGAGNRLATVVADATRATTGTIAAAKAARDRRNRTLEDGIAAIDRRIELRRATLVRQFAALEVALGNMQAQQSWLAGQVSSLNAMNG